MLQPDTQPAPPAVFLLATYGEGEPTDNARSFCKWLKTAVKKNRHAEPLEALPFAVFGLGDRRYEHFNSVAVLVDKQLAQLGASRLLPLGQGDDAQDLAADFSEWNSAFWAALEGSSGLETFSADAPGNPQHIFPATLPGIEEEDAAFVIDAFASAEEALEAMSALPQVIVPRGAD